ncbi:F-box only protein [Ooceraea biroi]|uniref:F-box only protein n=1 Tax=Ooceraea biroi TaxID=2015173 RepID=A0A026WIP4_OOCBI|nr:F-box only protein [Ooceraea biroi]
MASITDLSEDVIEIILNCNNNISIKDIVNLTATCNHFYQMLGNNNTFWRRMFYQRWPGLKEVCQKEMHREDLDFKELVQEREEYRKELRHNLRQINKQYYIHYHQTLKAYITAHRLRLRSVKQNEGPSWIHYMHVFLDEIFVDEEKLAPLLILFLHPNETTHDLTNYFLVDELTSFVPQCSQNGHNDDLTNIYYAKEFLPHLKHRHLENVWQGFINRPVEQLLLEKVAIFSAEWYQPEKRISYTHIEGELENIAQQVVEHLKSVNPNHPIFFASQEQLSFWKCHNIDENQWNNSDGRQILDSLCKIFFCETKLNFRAVTYWRPVFLKEYVLLNCVLEKKVGYTALLAIIFQSVARRLGIRCDLLSFLILSSARTEKDENYWLLKWKPKWNLTNPDEQYFYIDVLHDGVILNNNNWSRICEVAECTISSDRYCRVNIIELILDLSYYYAKAVSSDTAVIYGYYDDGFEHIKKRMYWCLRLLNLIKQEDRYLTILKSYIRGQEYICNFIQAAEEVESDDEIRKESMKLIQDIAASMMSVVREKEKYALKPKKRKAGMKFAVGMIVKVTDSFLGRIIVGPIIGWEEISLSMIERWWWRAESLYYIILCEDETYLVPEGDLEKVVSPEPLKTDIVGIYFSKFKDTYYMPNKILANEYPEDVLYLANNEANKL